MALKLDTLTLKRFRSVISAEISFSDLTILIGRNGAGKSNIADALTFVSEAISMRLDTAFDKRGGISAVRNRSTGRGYPPNLGIRLVFSDNGRRKLKRPNDVILGEYAFEIKAQKGVSYAVVRERLILTTREGKKSWFDRKGVDISSSHEYVATSLRGEVPLTHLALPWVGPLSEFRLAFNFLERMRSYSIDPAAIRRPQEMDNLTLLKSDGSNASIVMKTLADESPEIIEQVCEVLALITPSNIEVKPLKHGRQVTLEFTQRWGEGKQLNFEAFSASEGTLRALGILLALLQPNAASVLIIEEPESSLNPGAVDALLQAIREKLTRTQVILTTHSPELLDTKWIEPENLRLVKWAGGTTVTNISSRAVRTLRSHLMTAGELMRADALDEPTDRTQPELAKGFDLFPGHA